MAKMVYYRGKQYHCVEILQCAVEEACVTCTEVHLANLYRSIPRQLWAVIDGAGAHKIFKCTPSFIDFRCIFTLRTFFMAALYRAKTTIW